MGIFRLQSSLRSDWQQDRRIEEELKKDGDGDCMEKIVKGLFFSPVSQYTLLFMPSLSARLESHIFLLSSLCIWPSHCLQDLSVLFPFLSLSHAVNAQPPCAVTALEKCYECTL